MSNVFSCDILLITHNHQKYLQQALESIAYQDYEGPLKVKVYDDGSTDNTLEIIKSFTYNKRHQVEIFHSEINLGIAENYKRAFSNITSDYAAILEGDDFWADSSHISTSIEKLKRYPFASGTFSSMVIYNDGNHSTQPLQYPPKSIFTARDLAQGNVVGNFSCCVYKSTALPPIISDFMALEGYDWLSNLLISHSGFLVHNSNSTTMYRMHSGGLWSSLSEKAKCLKTIAAIDRYNRHFGGKYESEFYHHKKRLFHSVKLATIKHKFPILGPGKRIATSLVTSIVPSIFLVLLGLLLPVKLKHKLKSLVGY